MVRIGIAAVIIVLLAAAGALDAELEKGEDAAKPGSESPGLSVAALDMSRVFEECHYFSEKMAALHAEIEMEDVRAKRRADEIQAAIAAKGALSPDSPERKAREELYLQFRDQGRDFLRRESGIYRTVYRELQRHLEGYCDERGIVLVFRCGDQSLSHMEYGYHLDNDTKNPYWHANDITGEIIQRLNAHFDETRSESEVESGPTTAAEPRLSSATAYNGSASAGGG